MQPVKKMRHNASLARISMTANLSFCSDRPALIHVHLATVRIDSTSARSVTFLVLLAQPALTFATNVTHYSVISSWTLTQVFAETSAHLELSSSMPPSAVYPVPTIARHVWDKISASHARSTPSSSMTSAWMPAL